MYPPEDRGDGRWNPIPNLHSQYVKIAHTRAYCYCTPYADRVLIQELHSTYAYAYALRLYCTYCTHTATALQAAGRELSCTCTTSDELPRTDSARAREQRIWPGRATATCCCPARTTSDHECNNVYSIHCMHGVCCRYASSSIKHTHIIYLIAVRVFDRSSDTYGTWEISAAWTSPNWKNTACIHALLLVFFFCRRLEHGGNTLLANNHVFIYEDLLCFFLCRCV